MARAGTKTKSATTLSLLLPDAGRLAQGAGIFNTTCARRRCALPAGTAQGAVLAVSRGALALLGRDEKMICNRNRLEIDERDIAPGAESQIQRLDPMQLAIWISAAPDPQRSALALFYLDEFDYREILDIADLKLSELSGFLAKGRQQLQAWLESKFPQPNKP